MSAWIALGGSIVISAAAQIALKHGANLAQSKAGGRVRGAAAGWTLVWALSFAAATLLWILALRRLDISYAYPLLGLGYVLVTAMAAALLGERVSRLHWAAVLTIAAGAACVAGSV